MQSRAYFCVTNTLNQSWSCKRCNNTDDTKARVGLVVGPEFEYYLTDKFSLAGALLYSQQGAELDKTDVTFKYDYINVPIVANFYVLKGLALKAGLQPGFNVNAKVDAGKLVHFSIDVHPANIL